MQGELLSIPLDKLRFWEEAGIEPLSGAKHLRATCICPQHLQLPTEVFLQVSIPHGLLAVCWLITQSPRYMSGHMPMTQVLRKLSGRSSRRRPQLAPRRGSVTAVTGHCCLICGTQAGNPRTAGGLASTGAGHFQRRGCGRHTDHHQTLLEPHKKGPPTSPPSSPRGWRPCARLASSCNATFCCTPPTSGTACPNPGLCLRKQGPVPKGCSWIPAFLQAGSAGPPSANSVPPQVSAQAVLPVPHKRAGAEGPVMQVDPGHEHARSGRAPHSLPGPARGRLGRTACCSAGGLPSAGALPACLAAA